MTRDQLLRDLTALADDVRDGIALPSKAAILRQAAALIDLLPADIEVPARVEVAER